MTDDEKSALIEQAASAHRGVATDGSIRWAPAWWDLDEDGRVAAAALAKELRKLEAAMDPNGLSTTARLVLSRIRGG